MEIAKFSVYPLEIDEKGRNKAFKRRFGKHSTFGLPLLRRVAVQVSEIVSSIRRTAWKLLYVNHLK